ncbi:uncharacterized protein LOC122087402 [Macadamia integrifolia]|uniref:uncharacterized protein LOC122087402 n=1 Tax=Macadamia integrifolia TaxID=60698 RepID=UPI001C4F5B80|nr:uncharacterized protein LOC122087402 [Macadamia integrifolia]
MGLKVLSNRSWLNLVIAYDTRSGLRVTVSFLYFHKDRMLMGGDFNLNSGQHYTDSLMEVMKQTMLHHDAIFRNQVYELHRIYRIQKTLMKDLSWKEFEKYTSWTENKKSIPLPFQDPQEKKILAGERISSGPLMVKQVGSTSTANWTFLENCQDSYSILRQKRLNLQLPADEYICSAEAETPENGNLGPTVNGSSGMKEFFRACCVPEPEEVKLSLSTGVGETEKGCSSRSWHNKEACLSTLYFIDSEDSIERKSNEDVKPISSLTSEAPTTSVGYKHGVQGPFLYGPHFSGGLKEDISHRPFINNHSLANPNGINQENKSRCSYTGLNECHSSVRYINLFTSDRQTSCETTHIDLNRVKLDESSSFSGDPLLSFPSLTRSSPTVVHGLANESSKETQSVTPGRKTDDIFSDEASIVLQQDKFVYSALMDSKSEFSGAQACDVSTKCRENAGNKVEVIDLEHVPGDLEERCEDFSNQDIKISKEDRDFSLGVQNGFLYKGYQEGTSDVTPISNVESNKLCTSIGCTDSPQAVDDAEVRQINFERSEEDTVSSGMFRSHAEVQVENCKSSDATSKTNYWTGNNSCCVKDLRSRTVGEGESENSKSSAFDESGATQLGSRITETQTYEDKGELDNSKFSAFEESRVTLLGSEITETHSAEQDPLVEIRVYTCACTEVRSSDGNKTKQCHGQQHNIEKEMDILVQKAAESLVHISLDKSFCPRDCFGEELNALEEKEMSEQPQYSSDSFESITLRLPECSVDDYSVSSMPVVEVKEADKGCGWKLKRGSRLKDFQKDILPGLVSLSRHEICEDINVIGAVLRSREYRRNRSRNTGDENWCVPVKGRRSKLNYIGRRNYY